MRWTGIYLKSISFVYLHHSNFSYLLCWDTIICIDHKSAATAHGRRLDRRYRAACAVDGSGRRMNTIDERIDANTPLRNLDKETKPHEWHSQSIDSDYSSVPPW
jgi:hypothetical protein